MKRMRSFIKTALLGGFAVILPLTVSIFIFHLQRQYVHSVPVSVEETLRSVISCGAGSKPLLEAFHKRNGH